MVLDPWWDAALVGVLGLMVGSFLNVVIYRLPRMMERQWAREHADYARSTAGDTAPAEFLGHQQAGPAQLGGPLPPRLLEGHAGVVQSPNVTQRSLLLQEGRGGGGEQHLFRIGNVGHGIRSRQARTSAGTSGR